MSRVTPFVVLFQARSGSTFLISVLKNHPEVQAQGEVLVGMDPERQMRRARRAFVVGDNPAGRIKAVGYKVKFRDVLDFDSFGRLLHEVDAKVIHMYRDNTVKRVISLLNAIRLEEATGYWNLHDEKNRPGPFDVDPADFDNRLRKMESSKTEAFEIVARLERPTLTLRYEDILTNVDSVIQQLLSFLDVSNLPVGGRTLKTTSDDLRTAVTNFDELRARYDGTKFQSMFDEVIAEG